MKFFSASGLWYPADEPDNRVAGTLRFGPGGLRLQLLGAFSGGWSPRTDPYPLIHGVVGGCPHGDFATVYGSHTLSKSINMIGIGRETIRCNQAILGETHSSPEADGFHSLDLTFSYLTDWFGRSGLDRSTNSEGGSVHDVRYRTPEPVRTQVGGKELILWLSSHSNHSAHQAVVNEEAHILIRPLEGIKTRQIMSAYVRPLQDLISFATDTTNAIDELRLRGDLENLGKVERRRKYHLVFQPIFALRKKKDRVYPNRMLFTHRDAQDAGVDIFERWLDFESRFRAFSTVYFASLYAPAKYIDERFLRLMSSLNLLAAPLSRTSERTDAFMSVLQSLVAEHYRPEELDFLGSVIPSADEFELPLRLVTLMEEQRALMEPIVGDDLAGFVRSLFETMAYVERRIDPAGRPPLWGEDLHHAMEKVRVLIKILVLRELGFAGDRISQLLDGNENYGQLKQIRLMS